MLAGVGAAIKLTVLQLTVADLVHNLLQLAGLVPLEQRIPLTTPNDFDDVPTSTPEDTFEFLNDFSVTANRSIEPLKITVDYEM